MYSVLYILEYLTECVSKWHVRDTVALTGVSKGTFSTPTSRYLAYCIPH